MFLDDYTTEPTDKKEELTIVFSATTYKSSEKFLFGCQALAGIPVLKIAESSGLSRNTIYEYKAEVQAFAQSLDEPHQSGRTILT